MAHHRKQKTTIYNVGSLSRAPTVAMALGQLTASWAYLEMHMCFLLQKLTKLEFDVASAIMYAVNATSARLDVLRTVAERLDDKSPDRRASLDAIQRAVALSSRRNALVHHMWMVDVKTSKVYTFDYRAAGRTQKRRTTRTGKNIMAFCDEVHEVCEQFSSVHGTQVFDDLNAAFKAFPDAS